MQRHRHTPPAQTTQTAKQQNKHKHKQLIPDRNRKDDFTLRITSTRIFCYIPTPILVKWDTYTTEISIIH